MNHYTYQYLSHHPQIKKALFVVDKIPAIFTIESIIKESSLEEIYLYGRDTCAVIEFSVNDIDGHEIKTIDKKSIAKIGVDKSDFYVFFIDCIDEELYDDVKQFRPANVVFDFNWTGEIDYKIWEDYREFAQTIKIAVLKSSICYKLLDWEKDENSDIELSVIFPMYKVADYLPKLIEGITAWDAPYVEFLFVNDGSPDNSAEIIKKYQKKDARIKLLNKENGGCASAREFGLEHSKGRYVCLIDPDDFVDESMLKKLLFKALSGSYDIAYCGYNEYYNDTGKSRPVPDLLYGPYDNGTENREEIQKLIPFLRVGIWRMIFRREMLLEHNIHFYTDLKRFDDLPFKVQTLLHAKSVIAIPEHLYYYRLARVGQDVAANDERLYVHFDIFKHLDEDFKNTSAGKLMDLYHVVKIQTHAWGIKKLKKEFVKEYLSRAKKDLLVFYSPKQLKKVACLYCRDTKKTLKRILRAK